MKLKYKKLIMFVAVGTMALCILIVAFLPSPTSTENPQDAELTESTYKEIDSLVAKYFKAKLEVNMDTLSDIVTDPTQIDQTKWNTQKEYVEDYQNIKRYVIPNEDETKFRVYALYDMKIKDITTPAPSLSALYVTLTSDEQYRIYFSAMDSDEEEFIHNADQNYKVVDLKKQTEAKLSAAIEQDSKLKQFYAKLGSQAKAATQAAVGQQPAATQAPAASQPAGGQQPAQPATTQAPPANQPAQPAPAK